MLWVCFILITHSGFVVFVLNLKEGSYRFQFSQLAITILALLFVVVQAQFVVSNMLSGIVWYIYISILLLRFMLPTMLVVVNDISAYMVGKRFGKTRLIKISPKKTWEGYVGATLCTILFAAVVRLEVSPCGV
jgi:phosphatidate cytidylyltransferase